jgi:hypothetical protein
MLWGHRQEYDFVDQQKNWPSSTKHVLFVNEPNQEGQSDMVSLPSIREDRVAWCERSSTDG